MDADGPVPTPVVPNARRGPRSLVIATILREEGTTGVHTHVRQLRRFLDRQDVPTTIVTPFSWGGPLTVPVFGTRLALSRFSGTASVAWYRHWHEVFLRQALRQQLAKDEGAVVYAQGPLAARAALWTRRSPSQRIVMTVHFQTSQADEWARKRLIPEGGRLYRSIRALEQEVLPQLDGIVYVSRSARAELWSWLPDAVAVPSVIIPNFVSAQAPPPDKTPLGDLVTVGGLEVGKNHRFLLEVLASIRDEGQVLTLDLFGDGPCRGDLVRQARDLGIEEQVRFRGFEPDVRNYLPRYRGTCTRRSTKECRSLWWKRWPPVFPSSRAAQAGSPKCATMGSRPASGRSTTFFKRRRS